MTMVTPPYEQHYQPPARREAIEKTLLDTKSETGKHYLKQTSNRADSAFSSSKSMSAMSISIVS